MSRTTGPLSRTAKVWVTSVILGGAFVLAAIVWMFPSHGRIASDEVPATEAAREVPQSSAPSPVIAPPRPLPAQLPPPRLRPVETEPPPSEPAHVSHLPVMRQIAAAQAAAVRAVHQAVASAAQAADGGATGQ